MPVRAMCCGVRKARANPGLCSSCHDSERFCLDCHTKKKVAGFAQATPQDQGAALSSLAAIDNPLLHTPNTVACVTCHVSSRMIGLRAKAAMVDAKTLAQQIITAQQGEIDQMQKMLAGNP